MNETLTFLPKRIIYLNCVNNQSTGKSWLKLMQVSAVYVKNKAELMILKRLAAVRDNRNYSNKQGLLSWMADTS